MPVIGVGDRCVLCVHEGQVPARPATRLLLCAQHWLLLRMFGTIPR